MPVVDLIMPKLGESIMEATILKWHKKPGDTVKQDETMLDIATDKVDSEVPSTDAGTVTEILYNVDDVVPIGAVIARINTGGEAEVSAPAQPKPVQNKQPETVDFTEEDAAEVPFQPTPVQPMDTQLQPSNGKTNLPRFYSPLVLKIAQEEGVSMSELENIPGTGLDGRVSKKDMFDYIEKRKQPVKTAEQSQPAKAEKPQEVQVIHTAAVQTNAATKQSAEQDTETALQQYAGNVEIIEMDRMRKLIARFMVDSKKISPHVTSFTEADVTNLVMWRERVKKDFEKRENTKITFTPLFIEAIVKCIKKFPLINCSIDGDKIILKKDINIGMATALPSGNLIVPVIKNADQLNLVGLSKQVNNLADNARNNKLRPDDTQNGTFTLTNVGTFGSLMGTPIINQPQVAILAVGAIKKRPVVIETPQGDTIGIRHMMYLSMSYDHRIVDGSLGATFLTAVAKELEAWDVERSF